MNAAASRPSQRRQHAALVAVAVAALALPWLLQALGASFYISMAGRIVVYAIAATSLNLVLGYGGMVSFGHAAFVGLGAYVTGVMISEGVLNGAAHLAATLLISGVAAALIGAISLRTRGVYFIMITLAFAQMLFYLANSIKGYGGMVSFGHAAFVGLGAYVTGVMISEGTLDGGAHLLATLLVTGAAAALIGAISLRTRGVYFIMITLAFAQMLFYLANSIKGYGGDEGLNIRARSLIGFGLDLKNPSTFYYVALAVLAGCLWALARFVPSRLGRAVLAIRDDEQRAEALGFATFKLRWLVFVVAGMVAGIAGALSVNQQGYVSPNVLHWTQSGTLMVMVILGGVATLWGGVLGAAALLLLQEVLSAYSPHWEFWTGWVLLAVVLFARQGLAGVLRSGFRPR